MAKRRYLQAMTNTAAMQTLDNMMNYAYERNLQKEIRDSERREEYLSLVFRKFFRSLDIPDNSLTTSLIVIRLYD